HHTAYIDCDPGQSVIGPPTTVGMMVHRAGMHTDSGIHTGSQKGTNEKNDQNDVHLRFVGSTSPHRHLLQIVTGIKRLQDRAVEQNARKIVFDSCGFVNGKMAREFQFQVIELLQPEYLVAFKKGHSVDLLLENFTRSSTMKIVKLPVSQEVVERDLRERRNYREKRYRWFLQNLDLREINIKNLGMHGMIPDFRQPRRLRNLIFALCDKEQFIVTLGILRTVHVGERRLVFYSPPLDPRKVASLQFGSIYLSIGGHELKKHEHT
ncbi:MAG: Clp1/GlmU family protein, partial [Spirochaetota bacterium]